MPFQRGLVPPAILLSTIALIVCPVGWGGLGVLSIVAPEAISTAMHRYLCILLATVTICSMMVNLAARIMRAIRSEREIAAGDADSYAAGHATGYTEGLDARPGASVLAHARR